MQQLSRVEDMMSLASKLPPPGRDLFNMLYVQGMSEPTVCTRMSISPEEMSRIRSEVLLSLKRAVA